MIDDTDFHYLVSADHDVQSVFCFDVFLSFPDSCTLLVPKLSRPSDWSKVFVDCIHVVFSRPLGLVTGFNAIKSFVIVIINCAIN